MKEDKRMERAGSKARNKKRVNKKNRQRREAGRKRQADRFSGGVCMSTQACTYALLVLSLWG